MGACAARGDALMHSRGRVRHRSHDRNSGREPTLDPRGGNRGCHAEDSLLRKDEPADLAEQDVDVLWFHGDHHQSRAGRRVVVRERCLDAVALAKLRDTLRTDGR
jgi:hypothetical protein